MQQSVYQTKVRNALTCGLTCSRASLTMQLTSGRSVYTPVFEPGEDILSIHCDSGTILINAANYCYYLIVKIYRLTRYLFRLMLVFDINVSHGSVATCLSCGGIFHNDSIANLPVSLSVKEFWKSVNIWRSYRQKYSGMFFWLTVYFQFSFWSCTASEDTTHSALSHLSWSIYWRFVCRILDLSETSRGADTGQ